MHYQSNRSNHKSKGLCSYRKHFCLLCLIALGVLLLFFSLRGCRSGNMLSLLSSDSSNVKGLPHLNDSVNNELSTYPETAGLDSIMEKYMKRWELKGMQLAVSRNDTMVYAKGYGWAEMEKNQPMKPGNIMRIASVSKLVTAVGIMKLVEEQKLKLSNHVFGDKGVLNDTSLTSIIKDKRYFDITIEQLLRHQGGFTRYAGDPLFSTRYIMMQNHLSSVPDNDTLLRIILGKHLGYTPGAGQKYCNVGYWLLSLIIEKISHKPYEQFIQEQVLRPAGCFDFHLAGNYYEDKRPNEVKYYMHKEAEPIEEFNNSGRKVVKCYGENNIPQLLGAGAWCASAVELCHFISAIDGDSHYPDILSAQSVAAMTKEMDDHQFSLGWNFTPANKPWNRTGTLSGTSALVVRYPDTNQCWVLLTNTSTWKGQGFAKDTMALFEKLRHKYGTKMKPITNILK